MDLLLLCGDDGLEPDNAAISEEYFRLPNVIENATHRDPHAIDHYVCRARIGAAGDCVRPCRDGEGAGGETLDAGAAPSKEGNE